MRSLLLTALLVSTLASFARADDQLPKGRLLPLTPFDERQAKAAQEAWAKSLGKSSPMEKNSIGIELVLIPPGMFTMGSPASENDRFRHETQVDVALTKSFYLGKTEVTQGQWRAVMGTTPWKGKTFVREGDNYAATYVSWNDTQAFCKKLSESEKRAYRLPTEAEWEYACRAGTTTRFSFGDDDSQLEEFGWHRKNAWDKGEKFAHEVGQKKPNPFGLHDMHGNVCEMVEDVYAEKRSGGTDPLISTGANVRVNRGGGWSLVAGSCRSGSRGMGRPAGWDVCVGFRLALNASK